MKFHSIPIHKAFDFNSTDAQFDSRIKELDEAGWLYNEPIMLFHTPDYVHGKEDIGHAITIEALRSIERWAWVTLMMELEICT